MTVLSYERCSSCIQRQGEKSSDSTTDLNALKLIVENNLETTMEVKKEKFCLVGCTVLTVLRPGLLGEHVVGQHSFVRLRILLFLEWNQWLWLWEIQKRFESAVRVLCQKSLEQFYKHN